MVRPRRLTIFREEVISSPNNKFSHKATELFELFLAFGFGFVACHRVATPDDGVLVIFPKIILRTQEVGVCKVQQREVF